MTFIAVKGTFVSLQLFLSRYLNEIGYTDTIIDVRSNRVRSLLGLHDNAAAAAAGDGGGAHDDNQRGGGAVNGRSSNAEGSSGGGGGGGGGGTRRIAEEMAMDTEAAAMASFDFLNDGPIDDDDEMMAEDGLGDSDLKINVSGAPGGEH